MDISSIASLITNCFSSVVSWFNSIVNSSSSLYLFFVSGFAVYLVTRFLIIPIFGYRGSDLVSAVVNISKKSDNNSNRKP